jgi:hypothetical protein
MIPMRRDTWHRATFAVVVLLAVVPLSERFDAGAQATVAGTGTLSGTVDAPKPFKAAQVFVRNTDNNIMYSVYTANGRYRAVALLPGNYEITVKKIGFAVDSRKVAIRAGSNAVADFSMAIGDATPAQQPTFGVGAREDSIRYF